MNLKTSLTFGLLALAPLTAMAQGNSSPVKASAYSVACFGDQPGQCLYKGEHLAHDAYASLIAGKSAKVTALHYFQDRDDKIILDYQFTDEAAQDIANAPAELGLLRNIKLSAQYSHDLISNESRSDTLEYIPEKASYAEGPKTITNTTLEGIDDVN